MMIVFDGTEYYTRNVDCRVPVKTQWSISQPTLVLVGVAHSITVEGDTAIIE